MVARTSQIQNPINLSWVILETADDYSPYIYYSFWIYFSRAERA
jgi:hypothetical protein